VPAGLERLAAAVAELAAADPAGLGQALQAEQVLGLRRLSDQLEACWLRLLAAVDACGAAGAEAGVAAPSTQGWLRARCRMGPGAAGRAVRTARALHRGPLPATAAALAAGEVSYPHAAVLADATGDLPPGRVAEAEPVLLDAARRLDPGRLRRLAGHLRDLLDPEGSEERTRRRLDRQGLWLAATFEGMLAVDGLLDAEAGEAVQAALAPLARPTGPQDERSGAQRRADALGELARQALQAGHLPQEGGLRPQVTVTADLASLLARCGVGGAGGWGGVLAGEAARRLACDATVTRALVRRHANGGPGHDGHAGEADAGQATTSDGHAGRHARPDGATGNGQRHATRHSSFAGHHARPDATAGHGSQDDATRQGGVADHHDGGVGSGPTGHARPDGTSGNGGQGHATGHRGVADHHVGGVGSCPTGHANPDGSGTADRGGLAAQLRAAAALLPPPLGAPVELLELGRATRVVSPALRRALAVRDGGCAAPGCDRPPPWTDAHHLRHWLHGGPTSLENLVLLCRVHHVAVHEAGWRLERDPGSGRVVLVPPARGQPRGHAPPAA
jgi:hypothetical protein